MRKLLSETGLPLGVASPDTSKSIVFQSTIGNLSIRAEVDQTDGTMKLEVDRQLLKAEKPVFDPLPEEIEKLNEEGSRWAHGS
jgi:hypothetical protein